MPFADPNEYFRTHTAQTANVSNMRNERARTWFQAMQPVHDYLKQWMQQNAAMGLQKEGQRFEVQERIPAETSAQSGLYELQARLQAESPLTQANVEQTRRQTAGMPSAEEATAGRESEMALRKSQAGSYMPWQEEAKLERERLSNALKISGMNASNKDDKELSSTVTQYIGMMAARGLIPLNPTTGAPDFLAFDKDPKKGDKIAQLGGKLFDQYLDDNNWQGDRAKAKAFLQSYLAGYTSESAVGTPEEERRKASLIKETGVDRSVAGMILNVVKNIAGAPGTAFSGIAEMASIVTLVQPGKQAEAVRNWLNKYVGAGVGDWAFGGNKPQTPPQNKGIEDLWRQMR